MLSERKLVFNIVAYSVYRISPHCVFLDGPYPVNFQKLYKGIIVVVDTDSGTSDPKFYHLAIRTQKTRTCIWKRRQERMDRLVFDDACLTITCCYEQAEESPVIPKSLTLDKDIYDEIKEILPGFMDSCGCYHDKVETSGGLELIIK